jgi:hypothetical protein
MRKVSGTISGALAILTYLLGGLIYLLTLYLAYSTTFLMLLFCMVFPVMAQLLWLWDMWSITGEFFNYYTLICLAWVILAALTMIAIALSEKKSQKVWE